MGDTTNSVSKNGTQISDTGSTISHCYTNFGAYEPQEFKLGCKVMKEIVEDLELNSRISKAPESSKCWFILFFSMMILTYSFFFSETNWSAGFTVLISQLMTVFAIKKAKDIDGGYFRAYRYYMGNRGFYRDLLADFDLIL